MLLEERSALPKREVPMWLFGGAQAQKQPPSLGTAAGPGCSASAQPSGRKCPGLQGSQITQQKAPGWERYVKLSTFPELEDSCSLRKFLAWR